MFILAPIISSRYLQCLRRTCSLVGQTTSCIILVISRVGGKRMNRKSQVPDVADICCMFCCCSGYNRWTLAGSARLGHPLSHKPAERIRIHRIHWVWMDLGEAFAAWSLPVRGNQLDLASNSGQANCLRSEAFLHANRSTQFKSHISHLTMALQLCQLSAAI